MARRQQRLAAWRKVILPALAMIWLAAGVAMAQAPAPVVEAMRQGGTATETRIVIETNQPVAYRAFLLAGPNRLVVDMPSAQWRIARSGFFQGGVVKGYRSGDLPDGMTRVVFDLSRPAVIEKSFAIRAEGKMRDRLVVDVKASTQNLFDEALSKVHGDAALRDRLAANAPVGAPAPATSGYRGAANDRIAATTVEPGAMLPTRKPQRFGSTAGGPMPRMAPTPPPVAAPGHAKRVIIIDAGHGGHDPGAIGAGNVREKNITLSMAQTLKRELENTGRYTVHLTRDSDIFIPLRQRVAIARAKKGDLFLSLHADKVDRTNVRGASIYTLSETASDAETARLAERENRAGVVSGVDLSSEEADVADILLDLAMREKMNESNLLARYITDAMRRKNIRLLPNSHRSAGFAVLKAPDVPSALIEIGFLSNPDEAKLLNTRHFQENMARALREGVDAYFTKILALQKI